MVVADIGCGSGRDALPFLASGAKVIAIDNSLVALDLLKAGAQAIGKESELTIIQEKMENLSPLPLVDLVIACISLPYCHPANFSELWNKIKQSLKSGGIFAGHFFGTRDSWHGCDFITTHTEEELRGLFLDFQICDLEVTEEDKALADGSTAHRHTYHVVARKV
jgi:SAM-dependent methyltransferase